MLNGIYIKRDNNYLREDKISIQQLLPVSV